MKLTTSMTGKAALLLACTTLAASGVSIAEEQESLTGAFGYRLGASFDTAGHEELHAYLAEALGGIREYLVTPSPGYGVFDTYTVTISPISGRILWIVAKRKLDDRELCKREMTDLHKVLGRKYGPSLREDTLGRHKALFKNGGFSDGLTYVRDVGPRTVFANCYWLKGNSTDSYLEVKYYAGDISIEDGIGKMLKKQTGRDPDAL